MARHGEIDLTVFIWVFAVFLGSDIIFEHQDADGATHVVERRCRLNVEVRLTKGRWVGESLMAPLMSSSAAAVLT